jgi:hypothetical protein
VCLNQAHAIIISLNASVSKVLLVLKAYWSRNGDLGRLQHIP